jgi:4-amino-4-deoxy-L-arabinose transferase-like glycosyltransferase
MTRRDRLILWMIVAAGALLRLAYGLMPRVVRWDEAGHLLVASNLVAGRGYSELAGTLDVHLPPFLPLVSAALLKLGLAPDWATATIHIITGALLCIPIYLLGQALYGRRVGFIAAALVAVYPALAAWPYVWSTMTESPFLLFVFSGVWGVYRAVYGEEGRHRTLWYAAVGALFGLAYLVRPEGLTYFAVLGLFMAAWTFASWRTKRISLTCGVARLALSVTACLLVISPYVAYLHSATGEWLLSGKVGLILDIAPAYLANDQAAHDRAVSRLDSAGEEIMWLSPDRFKKSLSGAVAADPMGFLADVGTNIGRTWRALFAEDLFSPVIVVLIALGLFGRPWNRKRWQGEALLIATLLPLASFWLFFVISRFLVGALPVGMLWAAVGLDALAAWGKNSFGQVWPRAPRAFPRFVAAGAVALALTLAVMEVPGKLASGTAVMPWPNIEAGQWLAENTSPGAVLMTRSTEVALYAGRPLVAAPNATWAELVKYARTRNARNLLVSVSELRRLRPQYAALGKPDTAPPEVQYVRTFGQGSQAVMLYRFLPN